MRTDAAPDATLEWRPPHPTDVGRTLGSLRRGPGDPAFQVDAAGAIWRATRMPSGPATMRITGDDRGIRCDAWGEGAGDAVASAPDLLGARDDTEGFEPRLAPLVDAHRRDPGLRIPRSARVFEALVPAVLEQKVITLQAHASWRRLVSRFGTTAPGPAPDGMRVPPSGEGWASIPTWEWHQAGVDPRRARTIANAARYADRIDALAALPPAEARTRIRVLPGIGEWTAAEVAQRALGDADALSVGDYHLAKFVGHALVGRDVDDAGMVELLAPWAGHRYRVVRLLERAAVPSRPRRGPKMSFVDHRSR